MSNSNGAILFIHALTGLHVGAGTASGTVDLPVQRERHTRWPLIPGSSLKGVLRDHYRPDNGRKMDIWEAVFGPEKVESGGNAHAGALSLTDARILAFPVRSLCGVFAWVTCPAVLERLNRDLPLVGQGQKKLTNIPSPAEEQVACTDGSPLLVDNNKLVLEEFEFTRTGTARDVADWLADNAIEDAATRKRIKTHLCVIHDNYFVHFVNHATEIVARTRLDYKTKTVKSGALFYQEVLPPETLFYALLLAEKSHKPGCEMTAEQVLEYSMSKLPSILQIGSDETIGKGLCAVRLTVGKAMALT